MTTSTMTTTSTITANTATYAVAYGRHVHAPESLSRLPRQLQRHRSGRSGNVAEPLCLRRAQPAPQVRASRTAEVVRQVLQRCRGGGGREVQVVQEALRAGAPVAGYKSCGAMVVRHGQPSHSLSHRLLHNQHKAECEAVAFIAAEMRGSSSMVGEIWSYLWRWSKFGEIDAVKVRNAPFLYYVSCVGQSYAT